MSRALVLLLVLLATACGGAVDPAPPETNWAPYPACSCGWADDAATNTESCSAPFELTSHDALETIDDGASVCHVYTEACTAPGRADCAGVCKRTHATCQPTAPMGLP